LSSPKPSGKFSISLPESAALFVEQYRRKYSVGSRSEVIDIALRALRDRELESAYAEASREEAGFADLDSTSNDGLDDDASW
jgi:Arc/MetJ-type ribon-helix-helix transcriptional regulator